MKRKWPTIIRELISDIIGTKSRILIVAWLLALFGVLLFLQHLQGVIPQVLGFTGSREQKISFQYPVEVTRVWVTEGDQVDQKSPLLEAIRYDLTAEQAIIDENIAELRSRHNESIATTYANLQSLTAERNAKVAGMSTRINKLESQYQLNQKILEDIAGSARPGVRDGVSPLLTEISGLKSARVHVKKTLQAQIQNLAQQLKMTTRPADIQIAELEKRKAELKRQAGDLKVDAKFRGSIGSIYYKPGEQVPAFEPILTLHAEEPSYVKGYIHEKILSQIEVGQTVWIQSAAQPSSNSGFARGVVESVGGRLVEFPQRLKRSPMVRAWGREITVRLVEHSQFLLNEKVRIFLEKPRPLYFYVDAIMKVLASQLEGNTHGDKPATQVFQQFQPIHSAVPDVNSSEIEASGIVWDIRTRTYLVVSDEQMHSTPSILEMTHAGEVITRLPIEGADSIDDVESISLDGDDIYIAASLSRSKKKRLKPKRRRMIRMQRLNDRLLATGEIDLYDTLNFIQANGVAGSKAAQFLGNAFEKHLLEVESHAIADDHLIIGFKSPLDRHGNTVILKLTSVDALFAGTMPVSTEVWLSLALEDPVTGQPTALSDMTMTDDRLLLLSVLSRKGRLVSYFWLYHISTERLSLLATFPNKRAEGITLTDDYATAMIVFDSGGKAISEFYLTGVSYEKD